VKSVNGTMIIGKGVASSALLFRRCIRALHLNLRALLITLQNLILKFAPVENVKHE
jgi:hypothetical protein